MADILGIDDFDMARARRKLKRKVAAALISAMAETDADYEFIAKRLRDKPAHIEKWITGLITGETRAMDEISDLCTAMGVELTFGLKRYEAPERPKNEQPAAQAAA